jgi:hypothetical protein
MSHRAEINFTKWISVKQFMNQIFRYYLIITDLKEMPLKSCMEWRSEKDSHLLVHIHNPTYLLVLLLLFYFIFAKNYY